MEDNRSNPSANAEETVNTTEQKQPPKKKENFIKWLFKKTPKEERTIKTEIKEWIVALAMALIVVMIIQGFLFRIIRVDGQSMETTLHDGERLFVSVADVRFGGEVPRNSIVICHYPNRGLTYFVKRIVAVPGDQVYRDMGVTHVVYEQDGETVDVPLDEQLAMFYINGSPDDYEPYTLGENEYFAVGDNRYNSHDSRDWRDSDPDRDVGPITKGMIVGRVRHVIWPLSARRATN